MTDPDRKDTTILIADDEPYNLQWIVDFLGSLGYSVDTVDTVDKAISAMKAARYRAIIADLSIPLLSQQELSTGKEAIFLKYPGLLVADYARNHNHTDRQVIVYSVHDDPSVKLVAGKLRITYLLKGRPRILKNELNEVLSYDPLAKATD